MNTLHIDVSLANERLHQSSPNLTQCVIQFTQMSFIFKILICIFHFISTFYTINLLFQALQRTWKMFTTH